MSEPVRAESLGAALRNIAATLHSMLVTRIELVAAELALARNQLAASLALLLAAAMFLFLALVAVSLLVAVIFWETHRIEALSGLALVYALIGLALAWAARKRLQSMPEMLEATVDEFRQDAAVLRSVVSPRGAAPAEPRSAPEEGAR